MYESLANCIRFFVILVLGLETLAVVICCWRMSCLHAPAARSLQLLHYQTHIKLSSKDHLFFEFDRVFVLACGR